MGTSADLSAAPEALARRSKIVQLDDGQHVVVERWTAQKLFQILDLAADYLSNRSEVELRALADGGRDGALARLVRALGDRVTTLVQLSVRPEDREKIPQLAADDFLDVLSAVLELNVTEKFVKKLVELVGRLRSFGAVVPSTLSKAPTGSSAEPG